MHQNQGVCFQSIEITGTNVTDHVRIYNNIHELLYEIISRGKKYAFFLNTMFTLKQPKRCKSMQ